MYIYTLVHTHIHTHTYIYGHSAKRTPFNSNQHDKARSPLGVVVNVLNFDIVVSDLKLQSRYYVHFQTNTLKKSINSLISPVIGEILPLLFFYKDGFDIK